MVILLLVKKARAERSLAFSPALCFQAWEKDEAAPHPLPLCAPLTASESENHGVTECFGVEGTFRGHLAQPPCSKQGYFQPDHDAQSPVQPGLECFQGWGLHYFSGQPVPVFYHPYCKKCLPYT